MSSVWWDDLDTFYDTMAYRKEDLQDFIDGNGDEEAVKEALREILKNWKYSRGLAETGCEEAHKEGMYEEESLWDSALSAAFEKAGFRPDVPSQETAEAWAETAKNMLQRLAVAERQASTLSKARGGCRGGCHEPKTLQLVGGCDEDV